MNFPEFYTKLQQLDWQPKACALPCDSVWEHSGEKRSLCRGWVSSGFGNGIESVRDSLYLKMRTIRFLMGFAAWNTESMTSDSLAFGRTAREWDLQDGIVTDCSNSVMTISQTGNASLFHCRPVAGNARSDDAVFAPAPGPELHSPIHFEYDKPCFVKG